MTVKEFNTCVDEHADALYRFIVKTVKDSDVAKDIVQDTYEKLWSKLNDVETSNAKSYMFTTAYRTMMDYFRRKKNTTEVEEHHVVDEHNKSLSYDVKKLLNEALDKLPEIQRSVILLRDYEGYDYAEIGKITNLNESQVKVYIFRARKFLKEYIGNIEALI